MRKIEKYLCYGLVFAAPSLLSGTVFSQPPNKNQASCSLDNFLKITGDSIEGAKKRRYTIGGTSEGGEAEVFTVKKRNVLVKSIFFGETGQLSIDYYFGREGMQSYLVEMKKIRFQMPISFGEPEIASRSRHEFVICGEGRPNYPESDDVSDEYSVAKSTLEVILDEVKKASNETGPR